MRKNLTYNEHHRGQFAHKMANGAASAVKLKAHELIRERMLNGFIRIGSTNIKMSEFNQCLFFVLQNKSFFRDILSVVYLIFFWFGI